MLTIFLLLVSRLRKDYSQPLVRKSLPKTSWFKLCILSHQGLDLLLEIT